MVVRLDPGGGRRSDVGVTGSCRCRCWLISSDFAVTVGMVVLKAVGRDGEMGVSFGFGY